MKARTARIHYLVTFVLALAGTVAFSTIIGLGLVFPFVYNAITDFASEKFAQMNNKRKPAVEAARAKKEALQKQQAKLNKEKKDLEKKKKKLLNKQAKRIYDERVSEGYESSINLLYTVANEEGKTSVDTFKTELNIGNENGITPVEIVDNSNEVMPDLNETVDTYDHMSNGSMFRGISF